MKWGSLYCGVSIQATYTLSRSIVVQLIGVGDVITIPLIRYWQSGAENSPFVPDIVKKTVSIKRRSSCFSKLVSFYSSGPVYL